MTRFVGRALLVICVSLASGYTVLAQVQTTTTNYVCPMHTDVKSTAPGKCPRCNMDLVAAASPGTASKKRRPLRRNRKPVLASRKTTTVPPPEAPARNWSTLTAAERLKEMERLAPTFEYTCVMHPDVRLAQDGDCPICGMALRRRDPSIRGEYRLDLTQSPPSARSGQKVRLRFLIFDPQSGAQVKRFVVNHEKLFHLFVVSQDMNDYQHIHPQLEQDGSFTVDTVLPRPGRYRLHSDFFPVDGTPQVIHGELATAGYRGARWAQARLTPDETLTKTVDGINVQLKLGGTGQLVPGTYIPFKYHLSDAKTGEPIRDLDPYLGAWGHTLILNADQSAYLHSHPTEMVNAGAAGEITHGGPDVEFGAMFPDAGTYRVWTQFQRKGKIVTVSFTLRVVSQTTAHDR